MTTTVIMWIGLAALALAILVVIGVLCARVECANRTTVFFSGWMATDGDGDIFFYSLRPHRSEHGDVWDTHPDEECCFELPACINPPIDAPAWRDEPIRIELWAVVVDDPNVTMNCPDEETELF